MIKNAMKTIKRHTEPKPQYTVGDVVDWNLPFFDGRVTELIPYRGTIVKVNKVTVDVVRADNKNTVRLDTRVLVLTKRN